MGSYVMYKQPDPVRSTSTLITLSSSSSSISESSSSLKSSLGLTTNSPKKQNNPINSNACIVMEYMSRGSLGSVFTRERALANCVSRYVILC